MELDFPECSPQPSTSCKKECLFVMRFEYVVIIIIIMLHILKTLGKDLLSDVSHNTIDKVQRIIFS